MAHFRDPANATIFPAKLVPERCKFEDDTYLPYSTHENNTYPTHPPARDLLLLQGRRRGVGCHRGPPEPHAGGCEDAGPRNGFLISLRSYMQLEPRYPQRRWARPRTTPRATRALGLPRWLLAPHLGFIMPPVPSFGYSHVLKPS